MLFGPSGMLTTMIPRIPHPAGRAFRLTGREAQKKRSGTAYSISSRVWYTLAEASSPNVITPPSTLRKFATCNIW